MICTVIPVHNRKKFTEACLHSFQNQTIKSDYIIVVDDGSSDGTEEMINTQFSDAIVLKGNGNLFWTAAINMGIKLALSLGADYVLTMNNDTVASKNFIEKMMLHAKPDILLGALDIDIKSKKPYYGGELFSWRTGHSEFLLRILTRRKQKGLHEVSLFPGRGLLIPKRVFETVGLFEEKKLPHYLADYDFTQLARNKGFKVFCNYDAKIYTHPEEGGDHKIRSKKSLRNYINHLFSIRGGGNLRNFTVYAMRNCPPKDIVLALLSGYARRMAGYWMK
jgi:GT2 family glycosyltransferase